jgi:hypothetical protein
VRKTGFPFSRLDYDRRLGKGWASWLERMCYDNDGAKFIGDFHGD